MEILLVLFYIALFAAIIFFGPLQEFLHKQKSERELKKREREQNVDPKNDPSTPADSEKTGLMLSVVLILLAMAFFIWKILTTTFTLL